MMLQVKLKVTPAAASDITILMIVQAAGCRYLQVKSFLLSYCCAVLGALYIPVLILPGRTDSEPGKDFAESS